MRIVAPLLLLLFLLFLPSLPSQSPHQTHEAGELFQEVYDTLRQRYYDRAFRQEKLPTMALPYEDAANAALGLAEECSIVDAFLARIPSSHLALYSRASYLHLLRGLSNKPMPTLGFQLSQRGSRFFACRLLTGGPGARAGLLRGDRILRIDGRQPPLSRRLDRRSDDAHLDDPPLHDLLCQAGEKIRLLLERRPGETFSLEIVAEKYSALKAAAASVRVYEEGGRQVGYVHFWYVHHGGCIALLRRLQQADFADSHGLVLDLRGRGGSALEAKRLLRFFVGRKRVWQKPFVVLMDHGSRSAKEMLAYEFKRRDACLIVGERSAGALVPAAFEDVGQGMILMYPPVSIPGYTKAVELIGVAPDIEVQWPLAYSAGADPIRQVGIRELLGVIARQDAEQRPVPSAGERHSGDSPRR